MLQNSVSLLNKQLIKTYFPKGNQKKGTNYVIVTHVICSKKNLKYRSATKALKYTQNQVY